MNTFSSNVINVNIDIAQGETLDDLEIEFGFDLTGFSAVAKAVVGSQTVDLVPSVDTVNDKVTFGLLSATTQALTPGRGSWDLFLVDGSSVPRQYIRGEFVVNNARSY
jgi:hypothetical protein